MPLNERIHPARNVSVQVAPRLWATIRSLRAVEYGAVAISHVPEMSERVVRRDGQRDRDHRSLQVSRRATMARLVVRVAQ